MVAVANRGGTIMKPEKPEKVVMKKRGQITIPKGVRDELNLNEDEQFELSIVNGQIVLQPVITIAKDQAWYWTKEWQQGEREADQEIEEGKTKEFNSVDALLKDLFED